MARKVDVKFNLSDKLIKTLYINNIKITDKLTWKQYGFIRSGKMPVKYELKYVLLSLIDKIWKVEKLK